MAANGANFDHHVADADEKQESVKIQYLCGDCGALNGLSLGSQIVCHYCGYRIMYKVRTKQAVQFQAR